MLNMGYFARLLTKLELSASFSLLISVVIQIFVWCYDANKICSAEIATNTENETYASKCRLNWRFPLRLILSGRPPVHKVTCDADCLALLSFIIIKNAIKTINWLNRRFYDYL